MPEILSKSAMQRAAAIASARGIVEGAIARAALFTGEPNNDGDVVWYVDLIGEFPQLQVALKRDGKTLTYSDDDGNFSLDKLASVANGKIKTAEKNAAAAHVANKVEGEFSFPNLEAVRHDANGTVYLCNWSVAPDDDDDTGANEDDDA